MQKASASSVSLPARASYLWLQREDDLLFNVSMGIKDDCSILDLATKMSRCPVAVAQRLLDSEIPEMFGFEVDHQSEEEAEFVGLALSGVSLQACLLWCTASDKRPAADEIEVMMGGRTDMRPAMYTAREAGVWVCGPYDQDALLFLAEQDVARVAKAVEDVLARVDVPTPRVVKAQLLGLVAAEGPVSFAPMKTPCSSRAKTSSKATPKRAATARRKTSKFSSDAARRKYWAKRNASKRKAY